MDRSGDKFVNRLETQKNLLSKDGGNIHGIRSYGSTALEMCYMACGFFDGFWKEAEGACSWDICAGWVILKEAGGRIVNANPPVDGSLEEPDLCGRALLALRRGQTNDEMEKWVRDFWKQIHRPIECH